MRGLGKSIHPAGLGWAACVTGMGGRNFGVEWQRRVETAKTREFFPKLGDNALEWAVCAPRFRRRFGNAASALL